MLQTNWLRVLPWRALGRGRRTSEQVGVYRTSTGLIAARVRLDGDDGCSVEQLETPDLKNQRDEAAVGQLSRSRRRRAGGRHCGNGATQPADPAAGSRRRSRTAGTGRVVGAADGSSSG